MKRLSLLIIATIISSQGVFSKVKSVEIRMHKGAYYDVFAYTENNDTINLTQFEQWVNLTDLKINPDSTFFFYRYKRKGKSYRLVTYEFKSLKKLSEIVPGYGGDFEWNLNNQILHSWGCGTNCTNLRIYDSTLKEIFFTFSSGGFIYSPNKTRIAQLSMHYNYIWIFDLNSLNVNKSPNGYSQEIKHEIDWGLYKFKTNDIIVFNNITSQNIDLSMVNWVKLNPKSIGQFYEREIKK